MLKRFACLAALAGPTGRNDEQERVSVACCVYALGRNRTLRLTDRQSKLSRVKEPNTATRFKTRSCDQTPG